MGIQKAYKHLHQQLLVNVKASTKKQSAEELKKRVALLKYQKVNAMKTKQTDKLIEIDNELKIIESNTNDPQVQLDAKLVEGLKIKDESSNHNINHINDVANFLSFQRTYQELIERYNPGLRMTQEDKIKKTAHKVGFELPEEFSKKG